MSEPTTPQIDYVRSLQKQLHLPDAILDNHCISTFGAEFAQLDRHAVSRLIDQMIQWEQLPADLMRAKGQRDLF